MSKRKKKPVVETPAPRRGYPVPKNLIWKIANDIYRNKIDVEAIYNTLRDFYCDSYTKGYFRRLDDANRFKMARNKTQSDIFNAVKDKIEDITRGGVVAPKENITNQNKKNV